MGVPKQKRHCAAYGAISHRGIIIQKQKDFVIDVGQIIYQHRHDRMRMEQQAVGPRARIWLGEAPIGLETYMPWKEEMRQIDDPVRLRRRAANLERELAAASAREWTPGVLARHIHGFGHGLGHGFAGMRGGGMGGGGHR